MGMFSVKNMGDMRIPENELQAWTRERQAEREAEEERKFMGFVYKLLSAKAAPDYSPTPQDVMGMAQQTGVDLEKRPDLFQKAMGTVQAFQKYGQEQEKFKRTKAALKDISVAKNMPEDQKRGVYRNLAAQSLDPNILAAMGEEPRVELSPYDKKAQELQAQLDFGIPKPPEAPKTRERQVGNKRVTEEWDEKAGAWKTLSEGPYYKPDEAKTDKLDEFGKAELSSLYKTKADLQGRQLELKALSDQGDEAAGQQLGTINKRIIQTEARIKEMQGQVGGGAKISKDPSKDASLRLNARSALIAMSRNESDKASALKKNVDILSSELGYSDDDVKTIFQEEAKRAGLQVEFPETETQKKDTAKPKSKAGQIVTGALAEYQSQQPQASRPPETGRQTEVVQSPVPSGGPGFGGMRPEVFPQAQAMQNAAPQEIAVDQQIAAMPTEQLVKMRATERNPSIQRLIAIELRKRQTVGYGLVGGP